MDITNPRRILMLGPPDSGILDLVRQLTGTAPEPPDALSSSDGSSSPSVAGLSHTLHLSTKYYRAAVPIWLDELPHPPTAWRAEFGTPEAREVVRAVGAFVYVFRWSAGDGRVEAVQQQLGEALDAVAEVLEAHCGAGWEGVRLAVGMPPRGEAGRGQQRRQQQQQREEDEELDGVCAEHGFEYVDLAAEGRNEFGERLGLERVREALEANDWDAAEGLGLDDEEEDDGEGGLEAEELEMGREMFGLKDALRAAAEGDDGEDDGGGADEGAQVEELQRMMVKMQAIRDIGSAMPEDERKRFAARAVNDLMRDFK